MSIHILGTICICCQGDFRTKYKFKASMLELWQLINTFGANQGMATRCNSRGLLIIGVSFIYIYIYTYARTGDPYTS